MVVEHTYKNGKTMEECSTLEEVRKRNKTNEFLWQFMTMFLVPTCIAALKGKRITYDQFAHSIGMCIKFMKKTRLN